MRKIASSVYSEKERAGLKNLLKDLAKVFINKELEKITNVTLFLD